MAQERSYATGRRRTAVARVWVTEGGGTITVNHRPDAVYFSRATARMVLRQPFEATQTVGKYDVWATVRGGGNSAQAGAIRHGITRALIKLTPEMRLPLKEAGFVTRDPRKKERKKPGQRGARARFQFSKR